MSIGFIHNERGNHEWTQDPCSPYLVASGGLRELHPWVVARTHETHVFLVVRYLWLTNGIIIYWDPTKTTFAKRKNSQLSKYVTHVFMHAIFVSQSIKTWRNVNLLNKWIIISFFHIFHMIDVGLCSLQIVYTGVFGKWNVHNIYCRYKCCFMTNS